MPRTSQISLDPTRETAFAAFSCGTSNVNVLGMEDFMGDELKAFSLHMGRAKCAVDLGDGSERGEYVNQDYILQVLGRPHR